LDVDLQDSGERKRSQGIDSRVTLDRWLRRLAVAHCGT
jgi:hypothetical protein